LIIHHLYHYFSLFLSIPFIFPSLSFLSFSLGFVSINIATQLIRNYTGSRIETLPSGNGNMGRKREGNCSPPKNKVLQDLE
jgi:hypothetical protein